MPSLSSISSVTKNSIQSEVYFIGFSNSYILAVLLLTTTVTPIAEPQVTQFVSSIAKPHCKRWYVRSGNYTYFVLTLPIKYGCPFGHADGNT